MSFPKSSLVDNSTRDERRVLAANGGIFLFDEALAVGKTYIAIAIVASTRAESWARRPVMLRKEGQP